MPLPVWFQRTEATPQFDSPSVPLHLFKDKCRFRKLVVKMVIYYETRTIPLYVHAALWPNSKHSAWQRGEWEREGQAAEKAHTVPMCQQSSYFITYLRAEVGEMERRRMCVRNEGWGGEKVILGEGGRWCPAGLYALDLYITLLWCVSVCVCVIFFY